MSLRDHPLTFPIEVEYTWEELGNRLAVTLYSYRGLWRCSKYRIEFSPDFFTEHSRSDADMRFSCYELIRNAAQNPGSKIILFRNMNGDIVAKLKK